MTTEIATSHKSFSLKSLDTAGAFEAVISTDKVDRDGEIVSRQAFAKSIGKSIPLIQSHSWDSAPVGKGVVGQDHRGTTLTGAFFLDTQAGAEAYRTAKNLADLQEFSVGFRPISTDVTTIDGKQVRRILDLELFEASLVLVGAAIGTGFSSIKGARNGFADLDRWLGDVRSEFDDGGLSVKSLSKRGFDVEPGSGWLSFKGQAIYPKEVTEPTKDSDSVDVRQLRREFAVTAAPDYSRLFWSWFKACRFHNSNNAFLMSVQTDSERKALSEGMDTAGGFAAPVELRASVEARRAASAVIRPRATIFPTGRDQLRIPRYAANSTSPNTYGSNMVGGRFGPGHPLTFTDDPSLEALEVTITNLGASLKISSDLWSDSEALAASLIEQGGVNLAALEDNDFVAGAGLMGAPVGIFNTAGLGTAVAGAPTIAGLQLVVKALPAQYRPNAAWLMNNTYEDKARALLDATPRAYPRDTRGGIEGAPVLLTPFASDTVTCLCDLSSWVIVDRLSLVVRVLSERFGDTDQVGVILKERNGAGALRPNGFVLGTAS